MALLELAPARQPLEVFRDEVRQVCGAFDFNGQDEVLGRVRSARFGALELARLYLKDLRVTRDARCIASDPGDHYFLVMQERGHALMMQGDQVSLLGPGDMILIDSAAPSRFTYEGKGAVQSSLHLPRAEMTRRFGNRLRGGMDIRRDDALGVALRHVIDRMAAHEERNLAHFGETVFSLLGCLLIERERGNVAGLAAPSALLTAALHQIAAHYRNPNFGPAELAVQLGVTPRSLQRAFQSTGETARQRLLAVRLASARKELERRRDTVAGIAYGCGFGDLSYFYREYRKRYGTAPGATGG